METMSNKKSRKLGKKCMMAFMIFVFTACSFVFLTLLFEKMNTHEVEIVVPPENTEIVYSDVTFKTLKNQVKITTGKNISDTFVQLKPVKVKEENAYEGDYLTTGITVKFDVEKGGIFRVGVVANNETDTEKIVSVMVKGVELCEK